MSTEGRITAIWIKREHRGPMHGVEHAELVEGQGIAGNADQGGRRQITLLDSAAWQDACADAGADLDPSARRANVLLEGLDLRDSRGKTLRLGNTVVRILGETRPCGRMDEAAPGLRNAMKVNWRGGGFAEILTGGTIRVGDLAEWHDTAAE